MPEQARHIVVSGGGSGIGAQIAKEFTASKANVTILGRRADALRAVEKQTGAFGVTCDVTHRASLDAALDMARKEFGPISIAIANAGAAISKPFPLMSADELASMLDVNVTGVFNLWQSCLGDMKEVGWGRMIAIASSAGLKGYSYVSGYCAAKHAVIGLTRSLSLELACSGITVNSICPGFVETPMLETSLANIVEKTGMSRIEAAEGLKGLNPMKRFVQVEEVAAATVWLASEKTGSINGQAISINGGEV